MADKNLVVADDLVVSLDYTLRLDDGQIVDTSAGRGSLDLLQGQGQIIPGLEQALYGMAIGDEKDVAVAPEDGYGHRDPEALQQVPKDLFPADMDPEPGMALQLLDSTGSPLTAFVVEVYPDSVLLDFNHPLAGQTLNFSIRIAGLRAATGEELAHGHVH